MSMKDNMYDLARNYGREFLNNYAIGIIRAIVDHIGDDATKVAEIRQTLNDMGEVSQDRSLPWCARVEPFKGREHYLEFHESREELQMEGDKE